MPGSRLEGRKNKIKAVISKLSGVDQSGALKELSDKIEEYQGSGTKLGLEEVNELIDLYQKSGVFLKKQHDKAKGKNPEAAAVYLKMMKTLSKDYRALFHYKKQYAKLQAEDPEKAESKKMSIDQFFEATRTRTVSLNGKSLSEMDKSGAGLSVRYQVPVALQDEPVKDLKQGDVITGFFTEDIRPDSTLSESQNRKKEETRIADDALRKYPVLKEHFDADDLIAIVNAVEDKDPEWKEMIRKTPGIYLARRKGGEVIQKFISMMADSGVDDAYIDILKEIKGRSALSAKEKELQEEEQTKLQEAKERELETMAYGLIELAGNMFKAHFAESVRGQDKINPKAAVGQRNALMSDIAELLGCGDVVAFSEKMKIKTIEDGKTVTKKGVFMLPAEGVDPAGTKYDSPMPQFNNTMVENSKGLNKKIACLQLLDHICGNTDRHNSNFFMQFKDGKLTGIQGIDNDQSFGASEYVEKRSYSVQYKNMRIIPKSMADAVDSISPETLEVVLQGYELNEEEIRNTVDRFQRLKGRLKESREFYKDAVEGYLDLNVPRIVEDDKMDDYSTCEQLAAPCADADEQNLFSKVAHANSTAGNLYRYVMNTNKKIVEEAMEFKKSFMEQGSGSIFDNVNRMKEFLPEETGGKKKKPTKEEREKQESFRKMLEETEALLSNPDIRQGIIRDPRYNMVTILGENLYVFGAGRETVKDKESPAVYEPLQTDDLIKTKAYKAIDKALESTYDCLDKLSQVADQYQTLQAEMAEAASRKQDVSVYTREIAALKETPDFKKYMLALENRDKLSKQLERYTDVQRMTYDMKHAKSVFSDMYEKHPELKDPYLDSEMQKKAQAKVAAAEQKQNEKQNEKLQAGNKASKKEAPKGKNPVL